MKRWRKVVAALTATAISTIAWGGAAFAGVNVAPSSSENGQCPAGYTKVADDYGKKFWTADTDYSSVILVGGHGTDINKRNENVGEVDKGETVGRTDGKDISHVCGIVAEPVPELEEVTPVAPEFTDLCNPAGVDNNVTWTASKTGVIYTETVEGTKTTVNAVPAEGYVFPKEATTSWSKTDSGEKCIIVVTPVKPTQTPVCGTPPNDTFKVGETMLVKDEWVTVDGVKYMLMWKDGMWKVKAVAAEGYKFDGRDTVWYEFREDRTLCAIEEVPIQNEMCGAERNDTFSVDGTMLVKDTWVTVGNAKYMLMWTDGKWKVYAEAFDGYGWGDKDSTKWYFDEYLELCPTTPVTPVQTPVCGLADNDTFTVDGTMLVADTWTTVGNATYWLTFNENKDVWVVKAMALPDYTFDEQDQVLWVFADSKDPCIIDPGELVGTPICGPAPNDQFKLVGYNENVDYTRLGWDGMTYKVSAVAHEGFAFGWDDEEQEWITEMILTYTDDATPCIIDPGELKGTPVCGPAGGDTVVAPEDSAMVSYTTPVYNPANGYWVSIATAADGYVFDENGATSMRIRYLEDTSPCIIDPGELQGTPVCGIPGGDEVVAPEDSAMVSYTTPVYNPANGYWVSIATAGDGYVFDENGATSMRIRYLEDTDPCIIDPGYLGGTEICGPAPNDIPKLMGGDREFITYSRLGWDDMTYSALAVADEGYAFGWDDEEEMWITEKVLTYTDLATPCVIEEYETPTWIPVCGADVNDGIIIPPETDEYYYDEEPIYDPETDTWSIQVHAKEGYIFMMVYVVVPVEPSVRLASLQQEFVEMPSPFVETLTFTHEESFEPCPTVPVEPVYVPACNGPEDLEANDLWIIPNSESEAPILDGTVLEMGVPFELDGVIYTLKMELDGSTTVEATTAEGYMFDEAYEGATSWNAVDTFTECQGTQGTGFEKPTVTATAQCKADMTFDVTYGVEPEGTVSYMIYVDGELLTTLDDTDMDGSFSGIVDASMLPETGYSYSIDASYDGTVFEDIATGAVTCEDSGTLGTGEEKVVTKVVTKVVPAGAALAVTGTPTYTG